MSEIKTEMQIYEEMDKKLSDVRKYISSKEPQKKYISVIDATILINKIGSQLWKCKPDIDTFNYMNKKIDEIRKHLEGGRDE